MFKPANIILLLTLLGCGDAGAQSTLCDPALMGTDEGPLGYRLRDDDRCEGIYGKAVSATSLRVVSVFRSFDAFDPASSKPVVVSWAVPDFATATSTVRLRAESLKRRSYYRMDAQRPAGAISFSWPSNILSALKLERLDIGVTAWTRATVNGIERDVYLPVRVRQQDAGSSAASNIVVLMPGRELEEVYLTLGIADNPGRNPQILKTNFPLRYGYYPAERPIIVPITGLPTPGLYVIQIGARLREGGSASIELWFHHGG